MFPTRLNPLNPDTVADDDEAQILLNIDKSNSWDFRLPIGDLLPLKFYAVLFGLVFPLGNMGVGILSDCLPLASAQLRRWRRRKSPLILPPLMYFRSFVSFLGGVTNRGRRSTFSLELTLIRVDGSRVIATLIFPLISPPVTLSND